MGRGNTLTTSQVLMQAQDEGRAEPSVTTPKLCNYDREKSESSHAEPGKEPFVTSGQQSAAARGHGPSWGPAHGSFPGTSCRGKARSSEDLIPNLIMERLNISLDNRKPQIRYMEARHSCADV